MDTTGSGHVYRRREDIVGTLAHVDVIVGMDLEVFIRRERGDYFVQVHVGAGAGTRLKHIDAELARVLAFDNRFGCRGDRLRALTVKLAQLVIDAGAAELDLRQRLDQGCWQAQRTDPEIIECTLGLGLVERIGGNGHCAHAVPHFNLVFVHVPVDCRIKPRLYHCYPRLRPVDVCEKAIRIPQNGPNGLQSEGS